MVVVKDRSVVFAHVGDSRGVLGSKHGTSLTPKFITEDHKPNRPDEAQRISKMNGEVRMIDNEFPYRLFAKGFDYPGIAVSRSLGDSLAQAIGLSPEPQISQFELGEADLFILIASDGVWEFCSESDVLNILNSCDNLQRATNSVVNLAWERWIEHEGDLVDDITAVVLKLGS